MDPDSLDSTEQAHPAPVPRTEEESVEVRLSKLAVALLSVEQAHFHTPSTGMAAQVKRLLRKVRAEVESIEQQAREESPEDPLADPWRSASLPPGDSPIYDALKAQRIDHRLAPEPGSPI